MSSIAVEAEQLYRTHKETAVAIHDRALDIFYSPELGLNDVIFNALTNHIQQTNVKARRHFEANREQYKSDALVEAQAAGIVIDLV